MNCFVGKHGTAFFGYSPVDFAVHRLRDTRNLLHFFRCGLLLFALLCSCYEVIGSPEEDKSILVTSPNGGEHLIVNSAVTITWESSSTVSNVTIDFSPDGGNNWLPIVAGTQNDGAHGWQVPNLSTALALVRISEAGNPLVNDISDGVFTIAATGPPPPPPSPETEITVLSDPLIGGTLGQRNGGQFGQGGWQVTGVEDMIVYDLGRYIESGSFEIDLRNFKPSDQNTLPRHHVLSMFRNPWGNHNPAENPETVWDLHTGFRYDPGVKLLSWTYDQQESFTKITSDWSNTSSYHLKIVWQGNELKYFRNGILQTTHTHSGEMELRYLFVGRDFTISGDLVTGFRNNQYPAMIGPIYSNLVVKEIVSGTDQSAPVIQASDPANLYANGARLTWTTNEPTICFVDYGTTAAYGIRTPVLGTPRQLFSTSLFELIPNTTYHYRIVSVDNAGNQTVSQDLTFRTLTGDAFVFQPVADTFVEEADVFNATRDHANFGRMSLLSSAGREAYLRFSVTGLTAPVSEAILRLHGRQGGEGDLIAKTMTENWDENQVTWRTKPAASGELLGVIRGVEADKWSEIAVNSAIEGIGTVNIALFGTSSEVISFDSRESTNFQPELIVLTNTSASPAPKIMSFSPGSGAVGTEVTINGSHFQGASSVAFNGVPATTFSVESDNLILAQVPGSASPGKISVTTSQGAGTSAEDFAVEGGGGSDSEPRTSLFIPTDDSYVRSSRPTDNNGRSDQLRVRKTSVDRISFLKFAVDGLSDPVRSAKLRLFVENGSVDGGSIFLVENTLRDTGTPWSESTLTWENAPIIVGDAIADLGAVQTDDFVEVDLSAVITADGIYSFAIRNRSSDIATYSSKEGGFAPELVIVSGGQVLPPPTISAFNPTIGFAGREVTISGSDLLGVTAVSFDGTDAQSIVIDSNSQLRATVPNGAGTGPIAVESGTGIATSSNDFTVLAAPQIASFLPIFGPVGTEITIQGSNFVQVTGVTFAGLPAASFSVDSPATVRATVPDGVSVARVTIMTTASGTATSASEFTVLIPDDGPPQAVLTDDSFVRSSEPTNNYGDDDELRVRKTSSTEYYTYLKFQVTGLSAAPDKATLRLIVLDESPDGGEVYLVSNEYRGSTDPWTEDGLIWGNAPVIGGQPIHSIGATSFDQTVEIDVTGVVRGNGTYSFGIRNSVSDAAKYGTKEGSASPELLIGTIDDTPPQDEPAPAITAFTPISGAVGTEITIIGSDLAGVTEVIFNQTAASTFDIDSDSQVRAIVPADATTGKIFISNSTGQTASSDDFVVLESPPQVPPVVSTFSPISGSAGTEVTISGSAFVSVSEVLFDNSPASSFSVVSETEISAVAPPDVSTGAISIVSSGGTGTSTQEFQALSASDDVLALTPTDDAFVRSNRPTRNYGSNSELRVRKTDSAEYLTLLKFEVPQLSAVPSKVTLQLKVTDAGPEGGLVYFARNNYNGTNQGWAEEEVTWENAPELFGSNFTDLGPVSLDEIVEIDVTDFITVAGIYSFAVRNASSDATKYSSKEGILAPQLLIEGGQGEPGVPTITSFDPTAGAPGIEVTIFGDNFSAVTEVLFNGTSSAGFVIDSPAQLRALVPAAVTTGKISLSGAFGSIASTENFTAEEVSGTFSFTPIEDTFIRSKRPTNRYGSSEELRVRRPRSDSTITFLKFDVRDVAGGIRSAKIKLFVLDSSIDGGAVYSISNNFRGTGLPWKEDEMTWSNSPLVSGASMSRVGPVTEGETVEFDVTAAIVVDGIYSFAIKSEKNDVAKYSSKEGVTAPELLIETGPASLARAAVTEINLPGTPAKMESESKGLPEIFELRPNYPNPFNLGTTIEFTLPVDGKVKLVIYNTKGQEVRRLVDGPQSAGIKKIRWNGMDKHNVEVSSGTYFVELSMARKKLVRKITLQK